ncbi:amino acid transporter avt1i [Quercus suber]|uniref:Amino acid transporter avt1i n=1 Tax=Quercus suber TaxID=58331 RepID=A0AAW0KHB8_QUESU
MNQTNVATVNRAMVAVNGVMTNEYCSNASSSFGHGFLRVEFGSDCDFDPPLSLCYLIFFAVGVVGVGILSIPYALSQGGWLTLLFLFLVAILCWYTGLLLQRCMDANPTIKNYPDIAEVAFGCKGRAIVSMFLYLELYLVAVTFLILEGDNLDKLFPDMGFKIAGLKVRGKQGFVLLTALIILPTTWLRSFSILSYFSAGGVMASVIVVGCVFWAGAVDGVGFHEVLLVCFVTSTINYGSMAILGYMMYGENLNSQVTLNLPVREINTKIAIYTTLVNPLAKYAVIITPIADAIEYKFPSGSSRLISVLIRTAIVISTAVVALTVPFFGYVMAFVGAFLSVTASMLLPCLCYLKINKTARSFGLELIIIVGILVIGSFVGVVGTYTSLKQITFHISIKIQAIPEPIVLSMGV